MVKFAFNKDRNKPTGRYNLMPDHHHITTISRASVWISKKFLFTILFSLFLYQMLTGQPGGKAYQFLEVANSARVAAIGGNTVAVYDDDLNMPYHNPALLNTQMHHRLALNYVNYFAGIHYGYVSCATKMGNKGTFAGGIHYLNYGKFQGADENGLLTGTFRAADYSVNFYYSRLIDSLITIGITLKSIYSDLESYHSTAVAFDAGISYHNPDVNFTAGLVLRNMGWQVSSYYPFGEREPLPFNIAVGFSQGLQYAPLKFFLVAEHLEKWDLTYDSEESAESTAIAVTGESTRESDFDRFIDRFMRHVIVGAEFYPTRYLTFRLGYNYRRRQEMKIDTRPGMVGFSWGLGVRISKFQIDYGRSSFHLAGGVNYFSLRFNLDELNKNF